MLTGQTGILNRAQEAKEKTSTSQDLEYLQLKATEALTDYYQGNNSLGEDEYILKKWAEDTTNNIDVNQGEKTVIYNKKKYSIADIIGGQSEKSKVEQENMKQITISNATGKDKTLLSEGKIRLIIEENDTSMRAAVPNGFYYVTGTPSTGLVISDRYGDDDTNSRGGNQFVWVPCSGDKGVTYEKEKGLATTWKSKYSDKSYYYLTYKSGETTINIPNGAWTDVGGDSSSVKKYGGFYIARYEAGVPENASTFYANSNNAIYSTNKNPLEEQILTEDSSTLTGEQLSQKLIPVSKKNNQSWNFITQENAEKVAKTMYYNNSTIKSSLIDSYAWDTVIEWITTKIDITDEEINSNEAQKKEAQILKNLGTDSSSKGNYSNNYNIKLSNALYAWHRYDSSKISGVNNAWSYATKYKKGAFSSGYIDDMNKIEAYKDVTIPIIDTNTYNYTIIQELATGVSEDTKVKNIYDICGNMWEWTTETGYPDGSATLRAVIRGGSFNDNGSDFPVSYRHSNLDAKVNYNSHIGFRIVLYIQ